MVNGKRCFYLYKGDINRVVDTDSGVGTFLSWLGALGNVGSIADVAGLIKNYTKEKSAVVIAVSILASTLNSALQK